MIYIDYKGRFGNRLFQHFVAVILSENYGQTVANPLFTSINNKNTNHWYNEHFHHRFSINSSQEDDLYLDCIDKKQFAKVDDKIFKGFLTGRNKSRSNFFLNGFFQAKEVINKFNENKSKLFNNLGEQEPIEGTYIHLRLGDILNTPGKYCELEYYKKALEQTDLKGELVLSSDSPEHDFVKTLISEYNFKFLDLKEQETILTASRFTNKILSLGTFSWWIGFLGNQDNVICPDVDDYIKWHGNIFPFLNWKTCSINSK
tara:strand:+ start:756 stop:1532 length:777 start_codon:yes stop_codon:yes gene_type:complete